MRTRRAHSPAPALTYYPRPHSYSEGGAWFHPYSLHVFGMMLGFALVMRIQIAYQRYWEGTTQCHQASAKWADAVMQVRPRTRAPPLHPAVLTTSACPRSLSPFIPWRLSDHGLR